MRRTSLSLLILVAAAWLVACAGAGEQPSGRDRLAAHEVSVVHAGWHTSIVLARADVVGTGLLPEVADFPDARYLEFGWGDRAYYTSPEPTLAMALRAALIATPAVLHVAEMSMPPRHLPGGPTVITVPLAADGFRALVAAIAETFTRPDVGRARPIAPGLSPSSRFYLAEGTFTLFNTCNTWTARMLRSAGLDVSPRAVIGPADLMSQLSDGDRPRLQDLR